ncbi:PDR/VanB family oxidoreductase [Uliginosibacterium paludis]|uniref:PDR/VanB family oxidoreductase n=1 Tax=Uliginosibacterium paludis TaxID=1615952 RepID=A0ABV2CQU0_9RHOO
MMIDVFVRGIRIEAEDVRSFELAPLEGSLPPWQAGAHVMVAAAPGLLRAYSLCNHPEEADCYRIAVKRESTSRGGSASMHRLQVGDCLRISEPANLFGIDPEARTHLLLAGGIGITPLYAMRNALRARGAEVSLHAFVRSDAHACFQSRLCEGAVVHAGLDAAATRTRLDALIAPHTADPHACFYLCGPAGFMDAAAAALAARGVPASRIRSERFGAAPAATITPAAAEGARVRFARSGVEAALPAGSSILSVARAHGVEIPTSCEVGVCGACQSRVLAGEPEHLDQYLSAAERAAGDSILPCVSRCRTGLLVIDR